MVKHTQIKNKRKKDIHDYIDIYGMLIFTFIIAISTAITAYSAFYKIPEKIEEATSYFDWRPLNYKEQLMFINTTLITDDSYEILYECDKLTIGQEKTIQEYFRCNNGNLIEIRIFKDLKGECYQKFVGEC